MTLANVLPLLAVDPGTILSIIFVVIAFLSWISNLVSGNQKPARPNAPGRPGAPAPQGDARLQNEIDRFLKEVRGEAPFEEPVEEPLEIVELEPASTPPALPRPSQKRKPPTPEPKPVSRPEVGSQRREFRSSIENRHLASIPEIAGNVAEHVPGRIERNVNEHFRHEVDSSVTQHFGEFQRASSGEERERSTSSAVALLALLRDSAGVRQAILANEVLSRPKGRRT